uniref:Putative 2-octaprenyl-6-methoxyphenol 4-monooxygenase n=1 Tax=Paulinella micropora TaxID=1928728 RepID=A0A385I1G6_9EUKA|nr:putative 2-octaprenyl-6-methoxyphenol 4- monooxygenase [Paulinella micropora]AXY63714.1 putative 2-octaprenyl-6-methoxyphenol 4- monooxygenase [Paulinella micropora]
MAIHDFLHVQIRGAGLTGSLAALAFYSSRWNVSLEDPLTMEQLQNRSRAYAITHSSQRFLKKLDLWNPLEEFLVGFKWLKVRDQEIDRESLFGLDDLPQQPSQAVGWTIQHQPLMKIIFERLKATSVNLKLGDSTFESSLSTLNNKATNHLILACEGSESYTRKSLGINLWTFKYKQLCLTAIVRLRGIDSDQAFELFRSEGPFAILPLGTDLFQIVWSAPKERCRQLEAMNSVSFLDTLSSVLPNHIQASALIDKPRAFPVAWALAHRLHKGKVILVGEVAHRSHPVGGQGLNLCWRDVEVLYELALEVKAGKIREDQLPKLYGRRRWIDVINTLLITDSLVRLFSNRIRILMLVRNLGFSILNRIPLLRRIILSIMTEGPNFIPQFRISINYYKDRHGIK